jgi:hypothetical protein
VVHHIAFDGWSGEVFLRELTALYHYYHGEGKESYPLGSVAIQYKDYAIWQKKYLEGGVSERQALYWKNKLAGYEPLNLMTDRERPSRIRYEGDNVAFEFDMEASEGIKKTAQELDVSVYTVLLSAYYITLSIFCNQKDIIIGIVAANRNYPELNDVIGFFVNTLPLRKEIDTEKDVYELIKEVGKEMLEAQENQDIPFEKLVDEIQEEQDVSRHPLFQVTFSFQNFGEEERAAELFLDGDTDEDLNRSAKFDLSLIMSDTGGRISGIFNYAVSLFERETIENYLDAYKELVGQIIGLTQGAGHEA